MPTYQHFQEVKKARTLSERDKIGVCLTCRYWDVEQARKPSLTERLALCVQPGLAAFALIVSGSSACNSWQERPGVDAEAKAYAEKGEQAAGTS